MKRFALLTALTLAASGAAIAQQAAPPPDTQSPAPVTRHHAANPVKESARLAKELNLSADQTAKLEPIFADRDAKLAALNSNTSLSDEDRAEQTKAIRKATQLKLRDVLTPAQQQQMKDMKKKPAESHTTDDSPSAS